MKSPMVSKQNGSSIPGLGSTTHNAYIERCNRTVRHEWLDQNIFETIEEAQDQATKWLWTYNNDRPKIVSCGVTPAMKLKMAALFYKRTPLKMGGLPYVLDVAEINVIGALKISRVPTLSFTRLRLLKRLFVQKPPFQ